MTYCTFVNGTYAGLDIVAVLLAFITLGVLIRILSKKAERYLFNKKIESKMFDEYLNTIYDPVEIEEIKNYKSDFENKKSMDKFFQRYQINSSSNVLQKRKQSYTPKLTLYMLEQYKKKLLDFEDYKELIEFEKHIENFKKKQLSNDIFFKKYKIHTYINTNPDYWYEFPIEEQTWIDKI